MIKKTTLTASALMLLIIMIAPVYSQTCAATFYLESTYIDRGENGLIEIPVYLSDNCLAGGLAVEFNIAPPNLIEFVDIDFTDSPFIGWDYINYNLPNDNPLRLRMVALANVDTIAPNNPALPSGQDVFLFTIRLKFACTYYTDTTAQIFVNLDSTSISDTSGYYIFDGIDYSGGSLFIGDDLAIRGDANCNGSLIGSDVTFMVNYFRGTGLCPCSICAGDANGDGRIIGSDVTYLVRFFTGVGDPPPPCGE